MKHLTSLSKTCENYCMSTTVFCEGGGSLAGTCLSSFSTPRRAALVQCGKCRPDLSKHDSNVIEVDTSVLNATPKRKGRPPDANNKKRRVESPAGRPKKVPRKNVLEAAPEPAADQPKQEIEYFERYEKIRVRYLMQLNGQS